MTKPRNTMREALAAQALEEVDGLLSRIETLTASVSIVENRFQTTTDALNNANDQYKLAVTAFTEQAKAAISEHLQNTTARTKTEIITAMEEAAKTAFRNHAADDAISLSKAMTAATKEFKKAELSRMAENAILAITTSVITAAVMFYLMRSSITCFSG